MSVSILIGDCRASMAAMEADSVDSCVTDPPYHLTSIVKRFGAKNAAPAQAGKTGAYARASKGFMGQTWDGGDVAFDPDTWREVYRVLKPGAHLLAFSGTRTYHRMVCAIEDAGFEIRDQLAWVYGSGFPKSHNLDGEWQGWGTALKPAWEPICLARKPIAAKNIAANVLAHRTGAINVDGCRVEGIKGVPASLSGEGLHGWSTGGDMERKAVQNGRWPANIVHDGSEEVLAAFPEAPGQRQPSRDDQRKQGAVYGAITNDGGRVHEPRGDSGSAARFFYCAKTTTEERGEGNNHPTVKPIALMQWLCRLVTPPGGTILDPFMGSGSTLIAADAEQFNAIGCELSADYAAIAERRIRDRSGLFADVTVKDAA